MTFARLRISFFSLSYSKPLFPKVSPRAMVSSSSLPVVDLLSKEPVGSGSLLLDLALCCAANTQGCIVVLPAAGPHGVSPPQQPL